MKEKSKISGACFCSAVRYSFIGPTEGILNCHCSICRSLNDSDYTTWVCVEKSKFQIETGEDNLSSFLVSDKIKKGFVLPAVRLLLRLIRDILKYMLYLEARQKR